MELAERILLRWPVLLVGIFALVTLVLAAQPEHTSAHAGEHTNMVFELEARLGTILDVCKTTSAPFNECSVPVGGTFQVEFFMQKWDVDWEYVQFSMDYAGVTSKGNVQFLYPEETDGPDCTDLANVDIQAQPGSLIISCTQSASSDFSVGATADFNCTETSSTDNEIRLFVGLGDDDSYLVDEFGERHSRATEVRSMFINCVEPERADMHLEIEGGDALCDLPDEPMTCSVPVGGSFTVAVATDDPPSGGYDFVATEILYTGLRYNPAPNDTSTFPQDEGAEAEMVWPDDDSTLREPNRFELTGNEGFIRHGGSGSESNYAGNLLELSMSCPQAGTFPITLTAFSYPERPHGSLFSRIGDGAVLLNSEDSVSITCVDGPVGGVSLDGSLRALPAGGTPGTRWLLATIVSVTFLTVVLISAWYTGRRLLR